MLNRLRQFFIYLLTSAVLISGNGVVLAFHTCLTSSVKNVSLFKVKSCCSDDDKKCNSPVHSEKKSLTSKCCSSEITYQKINTTYLPEKSFQFPLLNLFYHHFFTFNIIAKCKSTLFRFIPPNNSSSLTCLFQLLRI